MHDKTGLFIGLALSLASLLLAGCPRNGQVRPNWLNMAPEATLRQLAASDARAQRDLGLHLLLVAGEAEPAEEALVMAAQRQNEDPLTWLALGVLRIEHGRPGDGMADLGRAVRVAQAARARPDWCLAPGVDPAPEPEDCIRLASIVEEAAARLLRESDYDGRPELATSIMEQSASTLEFASAYNLRRALEHDARIAGQGDEARSNLERSGSILRWRTIGPFGPYPNQSFDIAHPPERDDQLAGSYDLGPGRGVQPTWTPELSSSSVQLRSPLGLSGTWYAEAFVQPAETGVVDVRLWAAPNTAVEVTVGGVEVISRDDRTQFEPSVAFGRVRLGGGDATRVVIKISCPRNDPGFALSLVDEAGRALTQVDPSQVRVRGRGRLVEDVDLLELLAPIPDEDISPLRAFVTSVFARSRGSWTVADRVLWRVIDPSPMILAMRATASGSTPTTPASIQDDRLLSGMREAFDGDPGLWRARIVLSRQLASEDQGREAMDMLREGLDQQPENAAMWHELGVLARRLGLHTISVEAFEQSLRHDSRSCGSIHALAMMYHDTGLTREREEALESLVRCDATARTRVQLLTDMGRPGEAFDDLLRIQQIHEYPAGLDADLADLALSAGRSDRAREIFGRLLGRWPRSDAYVGVLADLDGETGGTSEALERIRAALNEYPWEMGGMSRLAAVLGDQREISAWRVDGLEHIRRYNAARPNYNSPAVFVLDRAVYRIYPDMSVVQLIHQITQVLAQEEVAGLSEFNTPDGGEVLTLRTIKPDGTIVEPLSYDPDETTNLTGVEVGDFVEWEFISSRGPSRVYPGGLQTPRFFFATPDTAMHVSEMIVLHPDDVEIDYVPRGPSPPSPEPVTLGGLNGTRFIAERVPSQVRESNMPSPNEVFPSIGVAAREDVRSAVASWSDGHDSGMRADWRMEKLVRDLREPAQTELELAKVIYDYVLDHVQVGRRGTPATYTLASGHGDPLLLYAALLRVAGFEPETVYSWTLGADRSGPYLVPGELAVSILRVELDEQLHWVFIGSRHAPFGQIPASIRGQPALLAQREPLELQIPDSSAIADLTSTTIEGAIEAGGTLAFNVNQRFVGTRATEFRSDVTRIPAAERDQTAAAMLGRQYPGAITESSEFIGIDDRHAPLQLRARVTSRMIGRREGSAILLQARLSQGMRYSALTQLSERRTTFVFGEELHETVVQSLRLPAGARVEQLCPEVERSMGSARFSVSCTFENNTLTHRLEMFIPPQRIATNLYHAFDEFLRAYDEAAATETRVRLAE